MDPDEYLALFGLPPNSLANMGVQPTQTPTPAVEAPQPSAPSQLFQSIPPVQPGEGIGQSQSASFRGVTDQGLAQAKKVYSGVEGRIESQTAPLQAQAEQQLGQQRANAQGIYDAQAEIGRATESHQKEMARLKQEETLFHQDAAALEQRIQLETKAESERYVGAYREQLAAVRAMTVDPTGPIASLSTAQAGGLSLAMFAQGFLAAQGIQIDVSGQLDRWVDRSIQEQQRRIQQAEKGAEDTLSLWNIARQSSQDDLEARTRYRGMVVAGMMAATEAKAAQFNSNIAMSKAKEANARLAVELGTIERQIQDGYFNKVHQVRQAEYQRSYQMGSLAQQSKALSETERHNKAMEGIQAEKNKGGGLAPVKHPGKLIRDKDGKVLGSKVEYLMDQEKASPETKKIGQQYAAFRTGIDRLRELRKPAMDDFVEKLGPMMGAQRFSEENRQYQRQKALIGEQLIQALTGAAAPESQMKRIMGVLADDSAFQKGGNASGLDDLENWMAGKFEAAMNYDPAVKRIDDDTLKQMEAVGKHYLPVSQGENESADIVNARKEEGRPLVEGQAADTFAKATNVDSQDVISRGGGNGYAATPDGKVRTPYWDYARTTKTDEPYKEEHKYMETLAHMIAEPQIFAGQESPDEIKSEAQQALSRLGKEDKYAKYLLDVAQSDPGFITGALLPEGKAPSIAPSQQSIDILTGKAKLE